MCQDGLPAAFRAEKKRAVTYDSFNRLVVYSLWLWMSEFCDKFAEWTELPEGRLVTSIREVVMAPRLRAGLSPEKSEALLNRLRFFHFPTAPVSFVAAYRSLFIEGGPSPAERWLQFNPWIRKRRVPGDGSAGSEDGGAKIAGVGSSERGAPKKLPEGKRKVGSLTEKGSEAAVPPGKSATKHPRVVLVPDSTDEVLEVLDEGLERVQSQGRVKLVKREHKEKAPLTKKEKREMKREARRELPDLRGTSTAGAAVPSVLGGCRSPRDKEAGPPSGSGVTLQELCSPRAGVDRVVSPAPSGARSPDRPSPGSPDMPRPRSGSPPMGGGSRGLVHRAPSSGSPNAGGSREGPTTRSLRATRAESPDEEGALPWVPRELAGVYGEFVVESQKAGDCFSLFQVPDVDTRGNPLSSRDDLDYQGPPEAESVWIRPVAAESVPTCEGCVFYVRRKLDLVQSKAFFWEELREAWERHRDATKVNEVVFFDNEADWRSRPVPEVLHSCPLRCSFGPPARRFAWSKGGTHKRGLNGHGIQFRLRVGVVYPYMRAVYSYSCTFRWNVFSLCGA